MYHRDSIFVEKAGDTIYIYKERDRWRYKMLRDTIRLIHTDTIVEYRTKEVLVEQPLSKWKQAKIEAFWWLLAALAAALVWIFRKPLLKLIRKWLPV